MHPQSTPQNTADTPTMLSENAPLAEMRRDALIEIRDDAIWILESCVLLIREDAIAILRYTIS